MRKQFFVKPRMLFRYVILTVILVAAASVISYWIMDHKLTVSPLAENLSRGEITALKRDIREIFIWTVSVLLLLVSLRGILYFHRLIGPIYVLEKIVGILRTGDLRVKLKLRKNDELKDLAENLEKLVETYSAWIREDRRELLKMKENLELIKPRIQDKEYQEILSSLQKLTGRFTIDSES